MATAEATERVRRNVKATKTAAYSLRPESVAAVKALVRLGVYVNQSHAVDEALKLLIAVHRDELDAEAA